MGRRPGSKDTKPRKRRGEAANGATEAATAPGPGHNAAPVELTDDQRQALFFQHRKQYSTLLAAKKAADAALKNACKLAKAELGDDAIDSIKDAILLETPEGEAELKARIERQMRVARWMGLPVGAQADLFGEDRTPAADKAFADGKRAGLAGETARPPHDPSTEQYRRWLSGHAEGQAVLAKGFGRMPLEQAADTADVRPRFMQEAEREASEAVDQLVN